LVNNKYEHDCVFWDIAPHSLTPLLTLGALMVEAVRTSNEMLVSIYQTTWCNIPHDGNLQKVQLFWLRKFVYLHTITWAILLCSRNETQQNEMLVLAPFTCKALNKSWCSNFLIPRICWNISYSCSLDRMSSLFRDCCCILDGLFESSSPTRKGSSQQLIKYTVPISTTWSLLYTSALSVGGGFQGI
jgi:hypothetical protein